MQPDRPELTELKSLKERWIGTKVIFREPPLVSPARIDRIEADNQWVEFQLTLIPTRGFSVKQPRQIEVGSTWDVFSFTEWHCHAIYVNWSLYFSDELVSDVETYAADLPEDLNDLERLGRILRRVYAWQRRRMIK